METKPFLPYSRQLVDFDDVEAVTQVLQSDWLTTGPLVERFESAVADFIGASEAVALSSGTAALHAVMAAIGIESGDEVIVPPMTFAATANAVIYQGGTPVFIDIRSSDLLLDPEKVEEKITGRTKAIIAVDYAGQPCDYDALHTLAKKHNLVLIADSCHSFGARYKGRLTGALADLSVFSFHPVKPLTTGEGGMVTTDNPEWASKIRHFRNHGIDTDHQQRTKRGCWYYEMTELGYNYRLSDIQCALGLSQLGKLPAWIRHRQCLARKYDQVFCPAKGITPLDTSPDISHGYHLYVVRVAANQRERIFTGLRERGIGVNVHFIPVYLHPYYREKLALEEGLCPVAEEVFGEVLSLPIFQGMTEEDQSRVVSNLFELLE